MRCPCPCPLRRDGPARADAGDQNLVRAASHRVLVADAGRAQQEQNRGDARGAYEADGRHVLLLVAGGEHNTRLRCGTRSGRKGRPIARPPKLEDRAAMDPAKRDTRTRRASAPVRGGGPGAAIPLGISAFQRARRVVSQPATDHSSSGRSNSGRTYLAQAVFLTALGNRPSAVATTVSRSSASARHMQS